MKKTEPKIELLPISELLPYPKNPRTHPKANVDKLAASLTTGKTATRLSDGKAFG